ncbi:MAG: anthrone oxygenase family protein [Flavobacteriales bacterium]
MARTILLLTAIATALMAGLFYSWTCSVIPGLARLSDDRYLAAMQAMNRAILNPLFFVVFLGAMLLLPLCTWQHFQAAVPGRGWLLLAATVVYFIGVMGITFFGNVPLNNLLDAADLSSTSASGMSELRSAFERQWVRLNTIRTLASVGTLVLVLLACLRIPQEVVATN